MRVIEYSLQLKLPKGSERWNQNEALNFHTYEYCESSKEKKTKSNDFENFLEQERKVSFGSILAYNVLMCVYNHLNK